ncbi:hypothetical protein [Flavobacterium sp.]|uniref:hypothetical protein n=1 Tax=Flavobacterium sp. TaxID=239 RepID=UPI0025C3D73E|nr:hypothetical protein [Flavobacterium sp.]MBA4276232.1 hypothetical protein [Flavobacterium sp.]
MKKVILIIVLFTSLNSYSQCTLLNIFPFNFGQTKFEITKILNSPNSIGKLTDLNFINQYGNRWTKYDYLKNDSIYKTDVKLNHIQDECFNGNKNIIWLSLADDKLYEISTVQEYSKDRYNEMLEDYNNYLNAFKKTYPYKNSFTTFTSDTHEKIGEGVSFYKVPIGQRNKVKIEEVSISYNIKYKSVYNSYDKKFISTSEMESCKIEIKIVNLKGTKLTNQAY